MRSDHAVPYEARPRRRRRAAQLARLPRPRVHGEAGRRLSRRHARGLLHVRPRSVRRGARPPFRSDSVSAASRAAGRRGRGPAHRGPECRRVRLQHVPRRDAAAHQAQEPETRPDHRALRLERSLREHRRRRRRVPRADERPRPRYRGPAAADGALRIRQASRDHVAPGTGSRSAGGCHDGDGVAPEDSPGRVRDESPTDRRARRPRRRPRLAADLGGRLHDRRVPGPVLRARRDCWCTAREHAAQRLSLVRRRDEGTRGVQRRDESGRVRARRPAGRRGGSVPRPRRPAPVRADRRHSPESARARRRSGGALSAAGRGRARAGLRSSSCRSKCRGCGISDQKQRRLGTALRGVRAPAPARETRSPSAGAPTRAASEHEKTETQAALGRVPTSSS